MPIETLGSLLLVAIAVVAVMAVVLVPSAAQIVSDRGVGSLMRLAGVAAVCAALSALMYVAYAAAPTAVNRAVGDVTMVLAPGMLWAGMRSVNNRPHTVIPIALTCAAGAATAAVSLTSPTWVSSGGKILAISITCLLIFAESQTGRAKRTAGALLVGLMCLAYALYSGFRIAAGFILGPASEIFQQYFGTGTTNVVTGVVILGTTAGVVAMRMTLAPHERIGASAANVEYLAGAVLDQAQTLTAYVVRLPEVRLIRMAFGGGIAFRMSQAAAAAIYEVAPGAMLTASRSGDVVVAFTVGRHGARATATRIREAYLRRAPRPEDFDVAEIIVEHSTVRTPADLATALAAVGARRPRITIARPVAESLAPAGIEVRS